MVELAIFRNEAQESGQAFGVFHLPVGPRCPGIGDHIVDIAIEFARPIGLFPLFLRRVAEHLGQLGHAFRDGAHDEVTGKPLRHCAHAVVLVRIKFIQATGIVIIFAPVEFLALRKVRSEEVQCARFHGNAVCTRLAIGFPQDTPFHEGIEEVDLTGLEQALLRLVALHDAKGLKQGRDEHDINQQT